MSSTVAELKKEGFNIQSVDVRYNTGKIEEYTIWRVPTFIYMRDGKEVRRSSGNMDKFSLRLMWREPLF